MKSLIGPILVSALILAGCSQSPKAKLEAKCLESGESQEQCSCLANAASKNLNAEQLDFLVAIIESDEDEGNILNQLSGMSLSDGAALMGAMEKVANECGGDFLPN